MVFVDRPGDLDLLQVFLRLDEEIVLVDFQQVVALAMLKQRIEFDRQLDDVELSSVVYLN